MDLNSLNLDGLPKPIQEKLGQMDPAALKSLLESLQGDELDALLAGAMGYLKKMSPQDKEAFQELAKNLFQDKG